MAPSSDSASEAIGEGGISCRKADRPNVSGESDPPGQFDECNIALGALILVAGVGDDLGHLEDLECCWGVGIQLVGPQFDLIVFLPVFSWEAMSS